MFSLAGAKYDKLAQKEGKEYRFMFVRADGEQLAEITKLIENNDVKPLIHERVFDLKNAQEALQLVANGKLNGKVIIKF